MDGPHAAASDQPTVAKLRRLLEISVDLNSTADLNSLLRIMMDAATELTGTEAASVMLLDPRTRELYFAATSRFSRPGLFGMTVPLEGSIAGAVLQSEQPILVPDVRCEPRFHSATGKAVDFDVRSILGVPMVAEGRAVGVLEALNKAGGDFTPEDERTLATLANLAALAIRKAGLIVQLQNANEQLRELDRLKSDFIAIASHELRTPMLVILGYAHLLRERVGAQELERVLEAAERLRDLMQGMFNLRYLETGQAQLDLSRFDLNLLVSEVIRERVDLVAANDRSLELELPPDACEVVADCESIRLVLSNLISNAVKFTPAGGEIRVTVSRRPDEMWVAVSDDGIGISETAQKRIFDRFYQVEPPLTRHHDGLGLGLSVAKDLVELQRGRIWVDSREGLGSTFTFALPLATL